MEVSVLLEQLRNAFGQVLTRPGLALEVRYRIQKLMDRFVPVADRVYLKTLKGGETLVRCSERARRVGDHLDGDEDELYRLLTELEATCDGLLKQAYEFRIKAG